MKDPVSLGTGRFVEKNPNRLKVGFIEKRKWWILLTRVRGTFVGRRYNEECVVTHIGKAKLIAKAFP
jgi:hypothetical protein